jgi:Tol biopolymer transport system component
MLIIAMAALVYALLARSQSSVNQPIRLALTTSGKATLPARVTVSPDGSRVAFLADDSEGKRLLWVRSMESLSAQPLMGTQGASSPFWSPDSHSIGYFANGKLFRVEAAGGRSQALCEVTETSGGTWNRDGVILFGGPDGLHRVSAQGGTPALITKIDLTEEAHRWPYFLPDGRHFVFLGDAPTTENHHIRVGSLDSQETQILFSAVTRIAYAPPGFLLYVSQGALVAQPFDPQKLKVMGEPTVVAERITTVGGNHEFDFSVSDNGVLAYQTGSIQSQLVWFDRSGKKLQTVGEPDTYASVGLSADGQRAAVGMLDPDGRHSDIWLLDLLRGSKSRLTFDPKSDGSPIWSPDGTRLVFYSNRGSEGHTNLFVSTASAAGEEKVLLPSDSDDTPTSWSRDGQNILFTRYAKMRAGVWLMPLSGDGQPKPLFQSPAFDQGFATFSPDGRFIAYTSNESGRWEVYVQSFPASADKLMVSSSGGALPLWRDDGRELFYITEDGRVMSAEIKTGAKIESRVPQQLFQTRIKLADDYPYAINSDGSRFLINILAETNDTAPMIVVLNWTAALKKQ